MHRPKCLCEKDRIGINVFGLSDTSETGTSCKKRGNSRLETDIRRKGKTLNAATDHEGREPKKIQYKIALHIIPRSDYDYQLKHNLITH